MSVTYKYDEVNRLTEEKVIGVGAISYSYDDVGNRQTRTSTVPGITSTTYSYNNNDQFTTDIYDANGSTTKSGTTTYEYDFENRIKAIKSPGTNITITYDADGNRTSKTVNGTTTKYLVDTNNPTGYAQVVEEIQSGKTIKTYTYGLNLISQREVSTAKTSYYGYDGQNIRYLTDDKGKVIDTYTYDAFGTLINKTGTTENNYLYAGEQYDEDLNFYYNRARYLNTETGRFQSRDTFEGIIYSPRSLHKYLYAHNDPVNFTDPSGNFDFSIGGLSIGINLSNVITGISVISIASTCAIQYQLSTSGADGGLIKGPCSGRRDGLNQMRVQLQEKYNHLASQVVSAPSDPGVSVEQLRRALELLFFNGRDLIPNRLESAFLGAIARSSIQYGKYPPGGVLPGDNFWREKFIDRGKEYRVDSENRSGTNLRVFY